MKDEVDAVYGYLTDAEVASVYVGDVKERPAETRRRTGLKNGIDLASCFNSLALCYADVGDREASLRYFAACGRILLAVFGPKSKGNPCVGIFLNNVGATIANFSSTTMRGYQSGELGQEKENKEREEEKEKVVEVKDKATPASLNLAFDLLSASVSSNLASGDAVGAAGAAVSLKHLAQVEAKRGNFNQSKIASQESQFLTQR